MCSEHVIQYIGHSQDEEGELIPPGISIDGELSHFPSDPDIGSPMIWDFMLAIIDDMPTQALLMLADKIAGKVAHELAGGESLTAAIPPDKLDEILVKLEECETIEDLQRMIEENGGQVTDLDGKASKKRKVELR